MLWREEEGNRNNAMERGGVEDEPNYGERRSWEISGAMKWGGRGEE